MLTADEKRVVLMLAEAWNAFLVLPVQHSDDTDEFRRFIHGAQDKVLCRPARKTMNED